DGGAAVLLDDLLLATVAADAGQRDPGDAGPEQRCFDFRQALGSHDGGDEFHGSKLARPFLTAIRFLHLVHDFDSALVVLTHSNRCAVMENVRHEFGERNTTFWRSEERRVGKECRYRWWTYV